MQTSKKTVRSDVFGTTSSAFGTKGRINHDSSGFYSSKLYLEFARSQPNFVGYEISEEYVQLAQKRLAGELRQIPMQF